MGDKDIIKKAFAPLIDRLYSFTKESGYDENFDFVTLIKELESIIVLHYSEAAIDEINRCLSLIENISNGDTDFFKSLRRLEYEKDIITDEHGLEGYEERHTWVPLPEGERESVNNDIRVELRFYRSVLEQMKNFSNYDAGKQSPLPKEENPKCGKPRPDLLTLKFPYRFADTSPENIKDLYNSLKAHEFISPYVRLVDFKKIFLGTDMPSIKIDWLGGKSKRKSGESSFHYFITQLFKLDLIDPKVSYNLSRKKWIITQALFTLNGEEITKPLKGQKPPKEAKELLDTALFTFSKA